MKSEIGKQIPRILVTPELPKTVKWDKLDTRGGDVCRLSAAYGLTPDPWQELIITDWTRTLPNGKPAATSCGLAVPRQNGKNGILESWELYELTIEGSQILHTAHRVDTARKSFLRLVTFFENPRYPELMDMVKHIRKTNGQEGITLVNGASIEFSSRVNGGKRGATYDKVVFDEAQELTDDQMEAIMSTMSAAPSGSRQIIYTGTPPSPVSPGTIFGRKRRGAVEGTDKTILWHEWSVENIGDVTDRDRWYETNPALGIRLDEDFTQEECSTLSEDGFARERLGWWASTTGARAIPEDAWENTAIGIDEIPKTGKKSFGVKFSPEGDQVALSVCVSNGAQSHVELIDVAPLSAGLSWCWDYLCEPERVETTAAIAVDGRNGAAALLDKLLEEYPKQAILIPGTKGVVDAASMLSIEIGHGTLTHWNDEGQAMLDLSAASGKRPIGSDGGWGFGGDISAPIESASLAYWANRTTRRDPEGGCVLL